MISVEEEGDTYLVVYCPNGQDKRKENYTTATIESKEEFERRVTTSAKRKSFTKATTGKIFDEIAYIEHQLAETGIGAGEFQSVFERLKTTVQGQNKASFDRGVRQSDATREATVERMGQLGEAILNLSVMKGKRNLVRGKSRSRRLNPELA